MLSSLFALGLVLLPLSSAKVIDIAVGPDGTLTYSPQAIGAAVGDSVVFHFTNKNHTVSQSSFDNPCGLKDGGLDSGFMPVAAGDPEKTFTIDVKDTEPIWLYCRQAAKTANSHCGAGMVFAINCGADGAPNSFTNFKNAALAIGKSLQASASTPAAAAASTTAAYGGYPIPAAPAGSLVTQTVTVESSTWATTYTSYPNSPAPTPVSLGGQVHKVVVGGPGILAFDPPHIAASPRDTVVFEFRQKNHTVTQSSFNDPCRPLSSNGVVGFQSGFVPVADNVTTFPTWSLTINDTAPVWAYCSQKTPTSHCGAGMVFAINSDETSARNFTAFQDVAKALNGTSAAASAAPTSTPGPGSASLLRVENSVIGVIAAALLALLV